MSSRSGASPAASGCGAISSSGRCTSRQAEYYAAPAPLQALGLEVGAGHCAGLRLGFRRLTPRPADDKANDAKPDGPVKELKVDNLPVHISGSASDAVAVYEQLFANCRRITHPLSRFVRRSRTSSPLPLDILQQIGFGEDETLFEQRRPRLLRLRICCATSSLSRRSSSASGWTGCASCCRRSMRRPSTCCSSSPAPCRGCIGRQPDDVRALHRAGRQSVRDELQPRAGAPQRTRASRRARPQPLRSTSRRTASSTCSRIIRAARKRCRVFPLYSLPTENVPVVRRAVLHGAAAAAPRDHRRSAAPARRAAMPEPSCSCRCASRLASTIDERVRELSVRVLASNRHLDRPAAGRRGGRGLLSWSTTRRCRCTALPARRRPRESLVTLERRRADAAPFGATQWKLVNFLSLNHLGLVDRDAKDRAGGLRELLGAVRRSVGRGVRAAHPRHRGHLEPADRAAAAAEERLQRGARHRDHRARSTRRPSRATASSCSARCSTASSPNIPRSTASPRR